MKRRLLEFAILSLVLASCLHIQFAHAQPTTIIVTDSADSGPGTLRQAIADSAPGDTIAITLAPGDTITLTNGQLFITNDLTIISSNTPLAIDAGGNSRVLEITSSNTVVLDSLTITNGNAPDFGGGILVDSDAHLTLTNCTVTGNVADAGGAIYIATNSTVAINNCILSANSATNNGGAIDNETNSTLTINDSTFTGNSARDGGAIANVDSVLIATNINVSANFAAVGGGIFNLNASILTLNNSTLFGNFATNYGGGIINTNGGTATINNSTISSNACPADQGGGIDNWSTFTINNCTIDGSPSGGGFVNNGGMAVCNNSTFFGNVALFDGGGFYGFFGTNILNNCTISGNSAHRRAGGVYENSSLLLFTNTIVAGNTALISNPEILGEIFGENNFTNGNPLLAPPGNYGGPTQTMPPLGGSPAINAGTDSVTNLLTTDQRGYPRLAGKHVDIGAVEIQPSLVLNTNDDGPGSLRATASTAPQLIAFTNTLSGQTIHLTSGQITLSNNVGIDASDLAGGILIDAGSASRVLEITASNTVTLDSLTITNGHVSDLGGGILVDHDASLSLANCTVAGNSAGGGGGIFNDSNSVVTVNNSVFSANSSSGNGGGIQNYQATLIINDSVFSNNSANTFGGGAVANDTDSTLVVNNSSFSGNSADKGGGVLNYFATSTWNNCTFSNNASLSDQGGGIYNLNGSIALNSCTVVGNSPGGGIANIDGTAALNNSTLSGNSTTNNDGGGIWNIGALALNNCTLFGNSAASGHNGGGIYNNNGTNSLVNCTISDNSADSGGGVFQDLFGRSLLTNTIVAGNLAANTPDIFGPFDGINNLIGDNPLLAPFGNYGGPSLTMPPLAHSAAIDAGLDSAAAALITDQRGYPRISGPHVDIGAVEAQLAPANNRPLLRLNRPPRGGTLSFTFTNIPTADFTVLSTTNVALPSSQWTVLGPPIQDAPGHFQFTDPTTTNKARFYLVVSP